MPIIWNNVILGTKCKILRKVSIGGNATIRANAVILTYFKYQIELFNCSINQSLLR